MSDTKLSGEIIEQKLGEVADSLGKTIEQWKEAEEGERKLIGEQIKAMESKIDSLAEMKKEAERSHLPGVEYAKNGEKEKFSFMRVAKLLTASKNQSPGARKSIESECGYELEVFAQMDKQLGGGEYQRSINAATDAGGGYTIPETIHQELIPEYEAASILSQAGVRRIDGMVGNVSWVKGGSVTADWLDSEAEETITDSEPTFSLVKSSPHPLAARVRMTWQMLNQSPSVTEAYVRERMASAIALKKDLAGINGSGSNGEPLGLRKVSGINTYDMDSPTLDWAGANQNVIAAVRGVMHELRKDDALVQGGKFAWLMEPEAVYGFERAIDADGRSLFLRNEDPFLQRLMGFPILSSTQLDTAAVTDNVGVFLNAKEVGDLNWGTTTFAMSDSDGDDFKKGVVSIRAIMATDFVVWQPTAICDMLNLDTTNA